MPEFEPCNYGQHVSDLLALDESYEIGPGTPCLSRKSGLSALTPELVTEPHPVADTDMANCCISGLWLRHNFLDQSHEFSQRIASTSGSFWHGIMHRREPDFSNAKYWFRRVGNHPVFPAIWQATRELGQHQTQEGPAGYLREQATWDPFRFVDLCEAVQRGHGADEQLCRDIARAEWRLLFDYCYRQATNQ